MHTSSPTVSIVIPVYNGERTIGPLVAQLDHLLARHFPLEIILVNDGSADKSLDACKEAQRSSKSPVHVLDLARNFGEHNAVMAGLHQARGKCVVIMDDDFQNPPEEVLKLVSKMQEGYDVVYTRSPEKKHACWRNLGSAFHNAIATRMLRKPRALYLSSFKAISAFVAQQIIRYGGPYPYIDGLILWTTRRIGVVEVKHAERRAGTSNYTFTKLVRLWLNMFTNFSILPLRLALLLGLLCSLAGAIFGVVIVIEWLQNPDLPIGWASLAFLLVMFSGTQLILLGIVGEYVGRIFMFKNAAPQFIVRDAYPPSHTS